MEKRSKLETLLTTPVTQLLAAVKKFNLVVFLQFTRMERSLEH